MISRLSGKLIDLDLKHAILDVSGVGYKVFIAGETIEEMVGKIGQNVSLYTYLAVRENSLDLYGFKNKEDLNMFEMLITVSGIGPKSALSILNVANTNTIIEAITTSDTSYLTKVSGIGKKNAEKIVVELKDKFKDVGNGIGLNKDITKESLIIDALKSLGFDEKQARETLKELKKGDDKESKIIDTLSTEDIIKLALKKIGK